MRIWKYILILICSGFSHGENQSNNAESEYAILKRIQSSISNSQLDQITFFKSYEEFQWKKVNWPKLNLRTAGDIRDKFIYQERKLEKNETILVIGGPNKNHYVPVYDFATNDIYFVYDFEGSLKSEYLTLKAKDKFLQGSESKLDLKKIHSESDTPSQALLQKQTLDRIEKARQQKKSLLECDQTTSNVQIQSPETKD